MKKLKYIILLMIVLGTFHQAKSQQLGQFNHYIKSHYLINPAASNTYDQNEVNIGYRKQWTGFDDGPTSFYFFGIMNVNKKEAESFREYSIRISDPKEYDKYQPKAKNKFNQTMGGMVFTDATKFTTHTAANLSYAINFPFGDDKDKSLSVGINGGVKNFKFNRTDVTVLDEDDDTYNNFLSYNESTLYYDLGLGLYLDAPKYFIGYSALQIPGENFSAGGQPGTFRILTHHFVHGGFKKIVGEDENIIVTPGFMLRYVSDVPFTFDVNLLVTYDNDYWGGLSYRNNAVAIILGMNYKTFKFGYSFDYNTTGIRSYNGGSHEILAGIVF